MTETAKKSAAKRGRCPVCGFRFRLCKDGRTVQSHRLYAGNLEAFYCSGGGMEVADD